MSLWYIFLPIFKTFHPCYSIFYSVFTIFSTTNMANFLVKSHLIYCSNSTSHLFPLFLLLSACSFYGFSNLQNFNFNISCDSHNHSFFPLILLPLYDDHTKPNTNKGFYKTIGILVSANSSLMCIGV